MEILKLHPINPETRKLETLYHVLNQNGLALLPTDSGYSLACLPTSSKALQRIYQLKKHDKKYQMSLLVQSFNSITHFAQLDNVAFKTLKAHCPGPYTWILPATHQGRKLLEVKRPTMGIRFPNSILFTQLEASGLMPLISTSAVVASEEYQINPDDLVSEYKNTADILVDMGPIFRSPTTIISFERGISEVVRLGQGTWQQP